MSEHHDPSTSQNPLVRQLERTRASIDAILRGRHDGWDQELSRLRTEITRLLHEQVAQHERLLGRMLPDWKPSIHGSPLVVFNSNHEIVGLASSASSVAGMYCAILLFASDYPEPSPKEAA